MTDKLEIATKLIEKYNELIELYWPYAWCVERFEERQLISKLEAEISSLKIQMDSLT